jgi:carboxyl-terminal processing protease
LFSFILAFFLSSHTAWAAARPLNINLDVINSSVQLIQRESMFDPSTSLLCNGGSAALVAYLQQKGLQVPRKTSASTVDGLRQELTAALDLNPEVDEHELLYVTLKGMLKPLDEPYTRFMTPVEYQHLQARVEGNDESGLGLHLEVDPVPPHALTVVEVFPQTPAAAGGLQSGDQIAAINGHTLRGMTLQSAKDLMAGPQGSQVQLDIVRHDKPVHCTIVHQPCEVPTVTYQLIAPRVGYIRIHAFSQNVASELDQALAWLDKQGVSAYVLDLRDNRGGYVSSAIDVASRLLPAGTLVMSLEQKHQATLAYHTYQTHFNPKPLAVLVNGLTASASEIVASALQDHHAATLIGTKSFGKGLVQKVIPMADGSAFAISTGRYLTPNGICLHKRGIMPDVTVVQHDYETATEDSMVHQAAQLLESHLSASAPPLPER